MKAFYRSCVLVEVRRFEIMLLKCSGTSASENFGYFPNPVWRRISFDDPKMEVGKLGSFQKFSEYQRIRNGSVTPCDRKCACGLTPKTLCQLCAGRFGPLPLTGSLKVEMDPIRSTGYVIV